MMDRIKGWQAWGAAVVAVWLGAFSLGADSTLPAQITRPAERWQLPPLPSRQDLGNQARLVSDSPLWGNAADGKSLNGGPATPAEPEWYVRGSYARDGAWVAIIRFSDGRPDLKLKPGDRLPSGDVISTIGADALTAMAKGKPSRISIYDQGPSAGSLNGTYK